MVTPGAKREAVAHAQEHYGLSERRACNLVGISRRVPDISRRDRMMPRCARVFVSWRRNAAGSAIAGWAICSPERG